MIELLGQRQKELLRELLRSRTGVTIDELGERLRITRTAVRQHLTALEADGLVQVAGHRASGGRPHQLFILTAKGHELFPRQYSWLAKLLVESVQAEAGSEHLAQRLGAMGTSVGRQLRDQHPQLTTVRARVHKLSELMEQLGYDATLSRTRGAGAIEASNCVFHELAMANPAICEFDRALLRTFTGSAVEHQECMAKGGHVCRFAFAQREGKPRRRQPAARGDVLSPAPATR